MSLERSGCGVVFPHPSRTCLRVCVTFSTSGSGWRCRGQGEGTNCARHQFCFLPKRPPLLPHLERERERNREGERERGHVPEALCTRKSSVSPTDCEWCRLASHSQEVKATRISYTLFELHTLWGPRNYFWGAFRRTTVVLHSLFVDLFVCLFDSAICCAFSGVE